MSIQGKIVYVGPLLSGVSKSKGTPWQKQEFALETIGQYPKKVAFSVMNDRIAQANLQMGQMVTIDVDLSSREYNGKWYTEVSAYKISNMGFVQPPQNQQPVYQQQPPQGYQAPTAQQAPPPPVPPSQPYPTSGSDLPF